MTEKINDPCPACGNVGTMFIGCGGHLYCNCSEPVVGAIIQKHKKALLEIADAANDLWALFSHNPDEIPYGKLYDQATTRLHRELGATLRRHSELLGQIEKLEHDN